MKLTKLTLANPKSFLAILAMFLVLAGIAYFNTPMRMMPTLESPILGIVIQAEGDPTVIEKQITIPVETQIRDIAGLRLVRSASSINTSTVLIQYAWSVNMAQAKQNLLAKVAEITHAITIPHSTPSIITVDPLNLPVVVYGISTDRDDWEKVRKEVEKVADDIRIGNGLSSSDSKGIRAVLVSGGENTASGATTLALETDDTNQSEPESADSNLAEMPVKDQTATNALFQPMPMWNDYTFDGKKGVEIAVYGDNDADSRSIVQKVAGKMQSWQNSHRQWSVVKVYDNSHFITLLSENMREELIFSVVLAGLMLLFFLQNIRAMLIVLITIPIALGGAFLIFPLLHMSLNSSTLVGLLLAIGRLVDDSIVVIHAVHRHIQAGMNKQAAALQGVKEVYLAILSSTIIMMIAVVPLAFAPGLTGIMFIGIVVPILLALFISFLISVTLTPLLAITLFKNSSAPFSVKVWTPLTWVYWLADKVLRLLEKLYAKLLRVCLRHRIITLLVVISIASGGISLFQKIGNEMMPLADTAQISLMYDLKADLSAEAKIEQSKAIEQLIIDQPEVEHISSELGMNTSSFITFTGFNPMSSASVSALITLKDKGERQASIWQVIDRLTPALQKLSTITRLTMKEMGADVMATAGAPAEIVLSAYNRSLLQFFATETFSQVQTIPELHLPHSTGMNSSALLWRENFKPSVVLGGFYRNGEMPSMQLVGKMWGKAERVKQSIVQTTEDKDYAMLTVAGRGDMIEMMDASNVLIKNLIIAASLVFLFLIIFFRSFGLPFIIFLAIPLELTGVLGALYLMQQTFSTVSILGIIILNGIDVATAILLIDFLQHTKSVTKTERNADVIAASQIRLRPVLMTVLITIIVLIPLALHPKAGIDAFSPLATVILGGLTLSSALVLIVIPTLFTIFDDMRLRRLQKK